MNPENAYSVNLSKLITYNGTLKNNGVSFAHQAGSFTFPK